MSRSFKKTPIFSLALCSSQALWKRAYNRDFRRKCAEILNLGMIQDLLESSPVLPLLKMVSDPWTGPSDGRHYWVPSVFWQKRGIRPGDFEQVFEYRRLMRK
jgi:hypothetical protein